MERIIAVANQKGGVGKTTTAINLSACLAEMGKHVLAIDLDPQGNTTSGLGVDKDEKENTVYELLLGESTVEECIVPTVCEGLDLIPSNVNLSGAEIEGYEIHMGESILKDNAGTATKITDSVSGKKKEEGAFAGNVCGTYIHGVFDKEASAEAIIRVIGEKKGIDVENMTGVDFAAFKEQQYDILAAELRKHLDMKKIYEILENGITEEE